MNGRHRAGTLRREWKHGAAIPRRGSRVAYAGTDVLPTPGRVAVNVFRSAVRPADLTANALAKVLHEPTPAQLEWPCCPITTVDRWVA